MNSFKEKEIEIKKKVAELLTFYKISYVAQDLEIWKKSLFNYPFDKIYDAIEEFYKNREQMEAVQPSNIIKRIKQLLQLATPYHLFG